MRPEQDQWCRPRDLGGTQARWPKETELQTVFQIEPGPSGIQMDIYFRLAVGFVVLALATGSIVLYVARRKTTKWRPKLYTTIFLPIWAIGWLCFTIPWYFSATHELDTLLTAYRTGDYQVAEGPVRVLRTQPASGHAAGDLVSVGGKQFELNFFLSTHAYHRTVAHDGALQDGVYAKVFHHNGKILRVDVKPGDGQQHLGQVSSEAAPSAAPNEPSR
jgi:hypothetical protein